VCLDAWAVAFVVGLVSTTVVPMFAPALVLVGIVLCAGAAIWRNLVPERWRLMVLISPLFLLAGVGAAALHSSSPDPLEEVAALSPGEVSVVGKLASPPEPGGMGYGADLGVDRLYYEGREIISGGKLRMQAPNLSVGVGDEVRVSGEISAPDPSGDFDYGRYLETQGISGLLYAQSVEPVEGGGGWIGAIHERTDSALGYGLRPDESAIVRGMVIGDRSRISEETEEDFQRSGITHILAISGMHVAVLSAAVYFLLRSLAVPLMARNPATIALVWLYVIVAGAPPSAVRAAVVATLVLAAPLLGRQISPLHFLTTMLAFVLAYNPQLVYNVGFQLSVTAVFGILLLRKLFVKMFERTLLRPFRKPNEVLSNLLAVSLAAQISTAPIIAASFGLVSVVGLATNLVAVPLAGPILALGMMGSVLGNLVPLLAYPVNAANGFLVSIVEAVASAVASLPFAAVETGGVSLVLVAIFYAGAAPAALASSILPEERWTHVSVLLVMWTALWLTLAATTSATGV
jgi:competence protein ComEC